LWGSEHGERRVHIAAEERRRWMPHETSRNIRHKNISAVSAHEVILELGAPGFHSYGLQTGSIFYYLRFIYPFASFPHHHSQRSNIAYFTVPFGPYFLDHEGSQNLGLRIFFFFFSQLIILAGYCRLSWGALLSRARPVKM
jgi:hypothetical protein